MSRLTLTVILAFKAVGLVLGYTGHWPIGALSFFGIDVWILWNLFVPAAQGLCPNVTRFVTDRAEIWLTIDDGPDPDDTPQILDLLDRHEARATFFLIGERAARWPELVREIVRRGHDVAHHTHTHPAGSLWCAGRARLTAELDDALRVLAPLAPKVRWFRPPVGIKHFILPRLLRERGLRCVDWSLRSGDWISRTPEAVRDHVASHLKPGLIVLMHEGPSMPANLRVHALALVLAHLSERKYRFVIPTEDQLR